MKYYININQIALSNSKLDLKEAAILEYIRAFCGVDDRKIKQLTISENGIDYRYVWINFSHLIKEMPLLGIKQKASISKRIKKIEKSGFIKTFRAPDRSLYIRLTPKIKELEFIKGVSLDEQGVSSDKQGVLAETNSTNNISINKYINNNNNNAGINPAFKEIMDYYSKSVEKFYAYKPKIDSADGAALKRALKTYSKQDIEDMIDFYLKEKADKMGITLKAVFSTHSLNLYEQKGRRNKFL